MKSLKVSIKIFLFFTLLTGVAYPLVVTGISQILFRDQANGSIIRIDGKAVGSRLIGQPFNSSGYFSPRPSACGYLPYPSGGSNLGLTSDKLRKMVSEREKQFRSFNLLDEQTAIPSEMVFASGSGLDPHISLKSALLQVERITRNRHMTTNQKEKLIKEIHLAGQYPQYGILGDHCINVLELNIRLDRLE